MSASVDDLAIRWALRIDAENMDGEEKRAFDDWVGQDDRHRGALFRARAGLALIDTMDSERDVFPAPVYSSSQKRFFAAGAIAASFVGLIALSWTSWSGPQYRTEVGEIRRVALKDGSVVLVNTSSDLEVNYKKTVRQLRLEDGEAWFKVAKNKHKPFVVDADGVHVQATGTAFAVRRRQGIVNIVVTEGAVLAWRDDQPQKMISISAGNAASISTQSGRTSAEVAPIGNRDPLAWRQGGVDLNETTVFDAAAEFNRYNVAKIEVANPRIGKQRMTGYFQIDRPDEFSQAVADVTGATTSNKGNRYVIE